MSKRAEPKIGSFNMTESKQYSNNGNQKSDMKGERIAASMENGGSLILNKNDRFCLLLNNGVTHIHGIHATLSATQTTAQPTVLHFRLAG